MSARWNELERGLSSQDTKRKHIPVWLLKQAERLDKQFAEVRNALADINVFNAGKKREMALELLAKWLPEAEKFTAQIKTVDNQIKNLNGMVDLKEQASNFWKAEANEDKETISLINKQGFLTVLHQKYWYS